MGRQRMGLCSEYEVVSAEWRSSPLCTPVIRNVNQVASAASKASSFRGVSPAICRNACRSQRPRKKAVRPAAFPAGKRRGLRSQTFSLKLSTLCGGSRRRHGAVALSCQAAATTLRRKRRSRAAPVGKAYTASNRLYSHIEEGHPARYDKCFGWYLVHACNYRGQASMSLLTRAANHAYSSAAGSMHQCCRPGGLSQRDGARSVGRGSAARQWAAQRPRLRHRHQLRRRRRPPACASWPAAAPCSIARPTHCTAVHCTAGLSSCC